jgi:hypothetical protein
MPPALQSALAGDSGADVNLQQQLRRAAAEALARHRSAQEARQQQGQGPDEDEEEEEEEEEEGVEGTGASGDHEGRAVAPRCADTPGEPRGESRVGQAAPAAAAATAGDTPACGGPVELAEGSDPEAFDWDAYLAEDVEAAAPEAAARSLGQDQSQLVAVAEQPRQHDSAALVAQQRSGSTGLEVDDGRGGGSGRSSRHKQRHKKEKHRKK